MECAFQFGNGVVFESDSILVIRTFCKWSVFFNLVMVWILSQTLYYQTLYICKPNVLKLECVFQFGNVTDPPTGSGCNKVIMLLTDGGTDNAEEIFKEYNWPNKTVIHVTVSLATNQHSTAMLADRLTEV